MMRKGFRMALAGLGLALLARAAQANPIVVEPFDEFLTGIIFSAFGGWLVIGGILRLAKLDLTYFGITGWILILLLIIAGVLGLGLNVTCGLGLMIWNCYLGLLVVYYLFPHVGVSRCTQLVNLGFHGCFFLFFFLGVKRLWDIMPDFIMYLFFGLPVGARVYYGVACKPRKQFQKRESKKVLSPNDQAAQDY